MHWGYGPRCHDECYGNGAIYRRSISTDRQRVVWSGVGGASRIWRLERKTGLTEVHDTRASLLLDTGYEANKQLARKQDWGLHQLSGVPVQYLTNHTSWGSSLRRWSGIAYCGSEEDVRPGASWHCIRQHAGAKRLGKLSLCLSGIQTLAFI